MTTTSDRDEEDEDEMEEVASNASMERRSSVKSNAGSAAGKHPSQVRRIAFPQSLSLTTAVDRHPRNSRHRMCTSTSRLLHPTSPVPVPRILNHIPIKWPPIPVSSPTRTATLSLVWQDIKDRITRTEEVLSNSSNKSIPINSGHIQLFLPSPIPLDRSTLSPISRRRRNSRHRGAIPLNRHRIGVDRSLPLMDSHTACQLG